MSAFRIAFSSGAPLCRNHTIVPQQGIDARVAPAEGLEGLDRRTAASYGEDLVAKPRARLRIENARGVAPFLEHAVGVGGQHLGPFVAVVPGGVAAGEDVREIVGKA